jgi:predicted SnoaL-like aldol condensation-catalyzing enzyme
MPRAYGTYATADFTEHNPEIGNGYEAKLAYFKARQAANPASPPASQWADVIDNVIVDTDLFAIQRHVFTQPGDRGRLFVDLWRVAGGKIVEHWDVIQPVPETVRNANTPWCGKGSDYASARMMGDTLESPTCGAPDVAANPADSRALVRRYTETLVRRDAVVAETVRRFNSPDFVQHSPDIEAGLAALATHLQEELSATGSSKSTSFVSHMLVQGDRVLVHRHVVRPNDPLGVVAVDIFRVTGGKIVEHWDVKQRVSPTSANGHTPW